MIPSKPMELEYGRKIISHIFKRNNYKTMVVGKPQPVETNIQWNNAEKTDYYFVEGLDRNYIYLFVEKMSQGGHKRRRLLYNY